MALSPVCLGVFFCLLIASASVESATTLTSNATGTLVVGRDSVALDCASQIAGANIIWQLDGQPLPAGSRYQITVPTSILIPSSSSSSASTLTISPVSMNDNGNFTCEAISGSTTETSNAVRLTLTYPPSTVSPKPATGTTSKPATTKPSIAAAQTTTPKSSSGGLRGAIANIVIGVVTVLAFIRIGTPC